jgi:hypothetical protein
MKKILKEWNKYINEVEEQEQYGNEEFEKRFVDSFSYSIQDRAFLKKIEEAGYDLTDHPKIGQLEAGMSHTWFVNFGEEGARFVIQEKVDRYLRDLPEDHKQYLEKFFGRIFGELNYYKMNRADVKYKRPVAYLGRHQLMDWWIADDGIDMFYKILKKSMGE